MTLDSQSICTTLNVVNVAVASKPWAKEETARSRVSTQNLLSLNLEVFTFGPPALDRFSNRTVHRMPSPT